jgi:hypothetical protein
VQEIDMRTLHAEDEDSLIFLMDADTISASFELEAPVGFKVKI